MSKRKSGRVTQSTDRYKPEENPPISSSRTKNAKNRRTITKNGKEIITERSVKLKNEIEKTKFEARLKAKEDEVIKLIEQRSSKREEKDAFIQELQSLINPRTGKLSNFKNLDSSTINSLFIDGIFSMSYVRGMLNDFMNILQEEGRSKNKKNELVDSKIASSCLRNFKKEYDSIKSKDENDEVICFCCGKPIEVNSKYEPGKPIEVNSKYEPINVSCDHTIPIITMLLTVDKDFVTDNLHYIHSGCNQIKSDKNIFTIYENIGDPQGIFFKYCKTNKKDICQAKFLNILSKLKFRPLDEIEYRVGLLQDFQERLEEFKSTYKTYFDDIGFAARTLTSMQYAQPYPTAVEEYPAEGRTGLGVKKKTKKNKKSRKKTKKSRKKTKKSRQKNKKSRQKNKKSRQKNKKSKQK